MAQEAIKDPRIVIFIDGVWYCPPVLILYLVNQKFNLMMNSPRKTPVKAKAGRRKV